MTKNKSLFLNYLIFILSVSCINNEQKLQTLKKTDIKHKFERQLIIYEYNDNVNQEIEIYVNEKNDTIENQIKTYRNHIMDSSCSRFYTLTFDNKTKNNIHKGEFVYHFDKKSDGELSLFILNLVNITNDSVIALEFDKNDLVGNKILFEFESTNDTVMGHMVATHFKNNKQNDSIRVRTIHLSIDNYFKTNNPFVGMMNE